MSTIHRFSTTALLLILIALFSMTKITGQTFFKIDFAGNPVSVLVENLTKGTSISLHGTDTLHLKLDGTRVLEIGNPHRKLTVFPNPMNHSCHFDFENTTHGTVNIQLLGANGSLVHKYSTKLSQGVHQFQLSGLHSGVYVIHVATETCHFSGSFVSMNKSNEGFMLIHQNETPLKTGNEKIEELSIKIRNEDIPLSFRTLNEMDFNLGDQLKFIGYATGSDNDTLYASPTGDQTITFTFCPKPAKPTTGTHLAAQTQIAWNWTAVEGATGYKFNTKNNIITTTDNGTSTTYTQTGLTCGTAYTLYVWAYNDCGNSLFLSLTQNTADCTPDCGSPVTFTYNGSEVTYGTVTSANNRCWLDRNLGAVRVATSSTDTDSYGDLFQWGRLDDGHQVRTSPTTATLSSNNDPGHSKFILGPTSNPFDWRSPQNPDLWQGVNGINNPCPEGFRIPTRAEWDTEIVSWNINSAAGAFASPIKLPMAGSRNPVDGSVYNVGSSGTYWSSTVNGISSWYLNFSSNAFMFYIYRAYGQSVRCIKDCPVPETPSEAPHVPSQTQIIWNWNTSAGATGYKYNMVNDYTTATDNGTSTTYTQTGLACGTAYTLYIWAYNGCGNSNVLSMMKSTSDCNSGCGTVNFNYNGSEVTYGTVTGANRRCWLDRNLGAAQVATNKRDADSYGDLFQWGRLDDGHQVRTSDTTRTKSNTDVPGHGNFILDISHPRDWRSPQNANLWQGVDGINNPCPVGFRLPTEAEWNMERLSWSSNNDDGAFASPLKLPLAGFRETGYGLIYNIGAMARYWTSTVSEWEWQSRYLAFGNGNALMGEDGRAFGNAVRCIKDCPVPDPPTEGIHETSQTQIIWNWNAAEESTGYKYNTVDDYATAIDIGLLTTTTQSDLICATGYVLYVWAYNDCGISNALSMMQSTSDCPSGCGTVTFNYNGSEVTYGTVTGANNRCWFDRNLGASRVAESSNDPNAYGDLFQWGRLDDGHQVRTSPLTSTLSMSDNPGHNKFIWTIDEPDDWRSPQNINLWQGVNGINNPCPVGFRLPIEEEWETERMSWSSNNNTGAFASPLKLQMAGRRVSFGGVVGHVGGNGWYWSSSVKNRTSRNLYFDSISAIIGNENRAGGLSVRCIKD